MYDLRLRAVAERALSPLVDRIGSRLDPFVVTAASALLCTGAAVAAWRGAAPTLCVALWLGGRVLDGLDGALARRRGRASDLGGYLDMMGDAVGYAAVPIGLAARPGGATWAIVAMLLAACYVNTMSWTYLSALAEKRAAGAAARGERTSITMPPGLVEGAETIAFYAVALAFPNRAGTVLAVMAVAVAVTIVQRIHAGVRMLSDPRASSGSMGA